MPCAWLSREGILVDCSIRPLLIARRTDHPKSLNPASAFGIHFDCNSWRSSKPTRLVDSANDQRNSAIDASGCTGRARTALGLRMLATGAAGLGELLVEAGLGPLGPVDRVFRPEEKTRRRMLSHMGVPCVESSLAVDQELVRCHTLKPMTRVCAALWLVFALVFSGLPRSVCAFTDCSVRRAAAERQHRCCGEAKWKAACCCSQESGAPASNAPAPDRAVVRLPLHVSAPPLPPENGRHIAFVPRVLAERGNPVSEHVRLLL